MIKKDLVKRINQLVDEINVLYDVDEDFKGYKASPLLKEIINLLEDNNDKEKDTLEMQYNAYIFVAEAYKRMGRFSLAAKYHEKALEDALILFYRENEKSNNVYSLLHDIIVERNHYVDDSCIDVINKVKESNILNPTEVDEFAKKTLSRRRSLKNDPIEMSQAYLAVIDEVEEKIDQNRTIFGMGACFEIWDLKAKYLAEKGIMWTSPAILNPRVMFD